jgi:dienelactone hydrolase
MRGRIALGGTLLLLTTVSLAKPIEEVVDVTVTVANMYGREFTQAIKVTVFRDDERDRSPFLVLNHGRPANAAEFAKMGRVKYTDNSKYFVSKGFVVFVPTRVGYGVTGGEDMEYSGACSAKNYRPVYEAAVQQSLKVIEHARTLPYVNAERGLIVGQSFGGATAIAVAAKNAYGVVAAVNFSGGGGGNPRDRPESPCRPDLLHDLFVFYGLTSRIPTLWLYSENDKYLGKEKPREWFNAFLNQGGMGEFVQLPPLMPPLGEDGHSSFTRNPSAWRPAFEDFLHRNEF